MKISGDVVRQLVERSKHELMDLRSQYDYKFMSIVSDVQPDSTETKEIVKGLENEFKEVLTEVEERKSDAQDFFEDFMESKNPSLPVIVARCEDLSELRKCLAALNDISLYEWVFDIANYPEMMNEQLKNIMTTPRKSGITPKDRFN